MMRAPRVVVPFGVAWGALVACLALFTASPSGAATGCALTFRHGGSVQADGCEDLGDAVAYRRFGGWVVVQKSALTSLADERGTSRFNPRWTPEEKRALTRAVPTEGGVPIATPAPEAPAAPPPQPPTVVYIPVPTPATSQPVYEVAPPTYAYPFPVVICPSCSRHHPGRVKPPFVRVVPTNPSDIGPMAIQKSFPPISPLR